MSNLKGVGQEATGEVPVTTVTISLDAARLVMAAAGDDDDCYGHLMEGFILYGAHYWRDAMGRSLPQELYDRMNVHGKALSKVLEAGAEEFAVRLEQVYTQDIPF